MGLTYLITTRSCPDAAECRLKQLPAQARIAQRKAEAKLHFQCSQDNVKAVQSFSLSKLWMVS